MEFLKNYNSQSTKPEGAIVTNLTDDQDLLTQSATFGAMTEATPLDWQIIAAHNRVFANAVAERVIDHLRLLDGDCGGFAVDRLEHSVQTATRAYRANRSEEYVVCSLLHDIGDTLGSYNHPDIAVAVLKPFVSDDHLWMVRHCSHLLSHGDTQFMLDQAHGARCQMCHGCRIPKRVPVQMGGAAAA